MSELGVSAVEAINWLTKFCGDVSRLVTTVEDSLRSRGCKNPWGGVSFWQRSAAYYAPDRWIPRYLCRVYVLTDSEEQDAQATQKRWAFFLVYLSPKLLPEPVALWGVLSLVTPGNAWAVMDRWLIGDDGPPFLDRLDVASWETAARCPEGVESFLYRACPVVELRDSKMVEEKVVNPIWEQLNR